MVSLFVGQRVRIVSAKQKHAMLHVGKEGMIVAVCPVYPNSFDVDCALRASDGNLMSWDARDLEPILPEGAQPSEFSFAELMDNLGVVVA